MTVRQQWSVILAVIVALGFGSYAFQRAFGGGVQQVGVGVKAPPFTARAVDGSGRVMNLADYKGHVILLNVWATWCGPCKAEMPTLETLYKMYGPQGLKIVAVSIDETASDDSVRAYARNMGLTFDVLHDPQYTIEKTYQVMGYPESFVIDKDGIIRKTWLGAADWASEDNVALVRQLLGLPAAVATADSAALPSPDARAALAPR
jgi:cytochrome c biogenesis protein CcmG, thiol:disulfide interchange protein DsbE